MVMPETGSCGNGWLWARLDPFPVSGRPYTVRGVAPQPGSFNQGPRDHPSGYAYDTLPPSQIHPTDRGVAVTKRDQPKVGLLLLLGGLQVTLSQ